MQLVLAESPHDFEQLLSGIFLLSVQEKRPGTFLHLYYALMAAILKMAAMSAKGPIRDGSISKSVHNISCSTCMSNLVLL